MLQLDGREYGAQCVGCSTESTLVVRNNYGSWEELPRVVLNDEQKGKMGGVFCSKCMKTVKER